ncbi:MAG TPA: hypothetical protein VH084_06270 [Mycobacterium sp.]|nr:hypothetical protein [Mycobacterium sp.]
MAPGMGSGGRRALAAAGRAGRLRKLSDEQLTQVADVLALGPKANGFATDMWRWRGSPR